MHVKIHVPYQLRDVADADTNLQRRLPTWVLDRWPTDRLQRLLCYLDEHNPVQRVDGLHCEFCGVPLVERTIYTHESSDWDLLLGDIEDDEDEAEDEEE